MTDVSSDAPPETLLDVFTSGTDPAWGVLAFALLAAAVYIRMLSDRGYPPWTWRLYLSISALIFATRGADIYVTHQTVLMALEIALLLSTALAAGALFYFIVNADEPPTLREILVWILRELRGKNGDSE